MSWRGLDLRDVKEMNFSEQESAVYELRAGDVLVAEASGSADEVGKPALWRGEITGCCFQNTLLRIRSRGVLPEYLHHYLLGEALAGRIGRASPGVGIHHIGATRLSAWVIALPPLAEQRRIVAAIEEQFSRLDDAVDDLTRAASRSELLRRGILDRAIDGQWPELRLGDVATRIKNGIFVSRPASAPPGVPILRISAVRPMALAADDVRFAPVELDAVRGFLLEPGDLLFTRYSGNPSFVGACAKVPPLEGPTLHPDKLIRVTVDRRRCLPAFVEIAFAARKVRAEVEARLKTTAGQVGISGGQLRSIPMPLPPLEEQRRIIGEVHSALSKLQLLDESVGSALSHGEALRRSILARAFHGNLVPQDPGDEPASVLLERIAAERAASPNAMRRRATMKAS